MKIFDLGFIRLFFIKKDKHLSAWGFDRHGSSKVFSIYLGRFEFGVIFS